MAQRQIIIGIDNVSVIIKKICGFFIDLGQPLQGCRATFNGLLRPPSSYMFLLVTLSTSEGWKVGQTTENATGFDHKTLDYKYKDLFLEYCSLPYITYFTSLVTIVVTKGTKIRNKMTAYRQRCQLIPSRCIADQRIFQFD